MGYDNVKLWFAKNEHNEIITIDDLKDSNTYLCPVCGSDLIPKATESKRITPHFAHVDKSKCSNESMMHFWFKHKFLEADDQFKVVTDKEYTFVCKEVLVEQEYNVGDKIYRPDVTIITECGETIYFEMNYSNKKEVKDYIDIWLELKNTVVEIDIKQLMNKTTLPSFKALFYEGKCFDTKKNDTYYNTIGKYKEKIYKNEIPEKKKVSLKELDWFWEDTIKYKNDELNIEHMVEMFDSLEIEHKEIVKQILKSNSCSRLYQELMDIKVNTLTKICKHLFKEIKEKYSFGDLLAINKIFKNTSVYAGYIEIEDFDYNVKILDILVIEDFQDTISKLANEIASKYITKKLKENKFVKLALKDMRELYDNKYSFWDDFSFGKPKVTVTKGYPSSQKLIMDFSLDKIVTSNKRKTVKDYIKEQIKQFEDGMSKINRIDEVIKLLKATCVKFNNLHRDMMTVDVVFDNEIKIIFSWYEYSKSYWKHKEYVLLNNILYEKEFGNLKKITVINKPQDTVDFIIKDITQYIFNDSSGALIEKSLHCKDCSEYFTMNINEFNFFIGKDLSFPKRCKSCRNKRKQIKGEVK